MTADLILMFLYGIIVGIGLTQLIGLLVDR